MRAVFDTSPLIVLSKLGYLPRVMGLFEEVIVPESVLEEISAKEDEVSDIVTELVRGGKVKVMQAQNVGHLLYPGLHKGELEVIALAKETGSIAILDDLKARKAARFEGLRVMGMLGILRILKEIGVLDVSPGELLESLNRAGFRIRVELSYRVMGDER